MKRKKVLQLLAKEGFVLKEGGNHTKVYDKNGKYLSAVSRQNEIRDDVVRLIEKQTGAKLLG
ncbi:hypothetical protein [Helicobacter japonicus]|uniref:hypothetical protein n=1 Tax=Helicobacter japonicus TaxID=425400 RepID=UPI00321FD521